MRHQKRVDSDGWGDAVRAGGMGDWLHIPGKGASRRRDLRGREIGTSSYCDSWWRNINDGDGSLMSSKEGKTFVGIELGDPG
jgi:hypothetical protein